MGGLATELAPEFFHELTYVCDIVFKGINSRERVFCFNGYGPLAKTARVVVIPTMAFLACIAFYILAFLAGLSCLIVDIRPI